MQLLGLTYLIAGLAGVQAISAQSGQRRLSGVAGAARPAVLAALAHDSAGPALIVCAQPHDAQDLAVELLCWSDRPVLLFPAIENLPYERVHLDRAILAARQAALSELRRGGRSLVITSARGLLQPVDAGNESAAPSTVRLGDSISIDALLGEWVRMGYSSTPLVEEPGTFSRRGGVIDIFPGSSDRPVRIELFGNDIDSLRAFDPATQRSLGPVETVTVEQIASLGEETRLSALERLLEVDTSGLSAQARDAWESDLAVLEAGASFDELAVFGPYLLEKPASLLDILPEGARVLIDGGGALRAGLDDLSKQARDIQQGMEEAGNLPPGLAPALLDVAPILDNLSRRDTIELEPGSSDAPGTDLSAVFTPAHLYAGRVRAMVQDLSRPSTRASIIVSLQGERLIELLTDEGVPVHTASDLPAELPDGVTILPGTLAEGWTLSPTVTLLSDYEIFGRSRPRAVPRRPRPARESFFAQFSPGDHVVHLEHGIGRFEGVTRMSIDGAEREYALVQYAGADRVYVPTDQLERLTRYIGVGDSAPQLSKLGGGEWQRARQRATQAAADIARDLIDLYSKRMARPAHAFAPDSPWQHELESSFPFPETPDQLQAVEQVKDDMEAARPMDRLVCADVGYGKTEVAIRAAFKAVMDGKQVAVLVPTTILAQQHFETFGERFSAFPIRVETLSRFRSAAEQRDILRRLALGDVDVIIGTHRLLSKDVSFKNLGLLVVDEEQRFGVKHKEQLKKLREAIDVLTLTATPIPRTLHMGLVGIREISVIETPPEGRLPIKTYLQPYEDRLLREAIIRELERGGQVYVVHNKVATIDAMAAKVRDLVPEARLLVGHGQMDETLLERVMLDFAHQRADVLLCSTIIENGLDIPNVNTIIVNNAHRLGLTQLYQLRGRVGRSANQAYAYLLYPRDVRLNRDAARRMEAVFEAQELGAGINIAMKDLEIRGVGNLLGAEQSGHATAIGFDLYTRMIGEAVERMRGVQVEEPVSVTIDLPLTMYLPAEYIGNESERLILYRRMASLEDATHLEDLVAELTDRFGALPLPVQNLITSVRIKLAAREAHVTSISLGQDFLSVRVQPNALFDRVSLYQAYGTEARISTNVLRIPRTQLGDDWLAQVRRILDEMVALRASLQRRQPVEA